VPHSGSSAAYLSDRIDSPLVDACARPLGATAESSRGLLPDGPTVRAARGTCRVATGCWM